MIKQITVSKTGMILGLGDDDKVYRWLMSGEWKLLKKVDEP